MRPTLPFILEQILQFWPPYSQEHDDELDQEAEQSAASAREGNDPREGPVH